MAHQRDAYLKAGLDGVVAKPISPTALLEEVARVSKACGTRSRQEHGEQAVA